MKKKLSWVVAFALTKNSIALVILSFDPDNYRDQEVEGSRAIQLVPISTLWRNLSNLKNEIKYDLEYCVDFSIKSKWSPFDKHLILPLRQILRNLASVRMTSVSGRNS